MEGYVCLQKKTDFEIGHVARSILVLSNFLLVQVDTLLVIMFTVL